MQAHRQIGRLTLQRLVQHPGRNTRQRIRILAALTYLLALGIGCIADLRDADPEELYRRECLMKGFQEDRCALYVWRLAVYYAEHETHEPEKLKWWYWKDRPYPDPDEGENIHEFAE